MFTLDWPADKNVYLKVCALSSPDRQSSYEQGKVSSLTLTLILVILHWPVPVLGLADNVAFSGWGGSGLKATDCLYTTCNSTWPYSPVFPGHNTTTFEMEASKLHTLGYNASFNPGGGTFP